MKYLISDGSEVNIRVGDKVRLVDEWAAKYPGFLVVQDTQDEYLKLDVNKKKEVQFFSPKLVAEHLGERDIKNKDLEPIIKAILDQELPKILEKTFRDAVKDKLTKEFFDTVAKNTIEATIKKTMADTFKQLADVIDPPKKAKP